MSSTSAQSSEDAHLNTRYWPATFEERGATVPFTTPILSNSRVRRGDRDVPEILVPGLSGGRGTYVIPWPALPNVFSMTVHDRMLHEEMLTIEETAPNAIRIAALRIAGTGLAGPEAKRNAHKLLAEEENQKITSNFVLISQVVHNLSGGSVSLTVAEVGSADGQRRTKQVLSEIGRKLGINAEMLYERIERWAQQLNAVGIPTGPIEPRQRRLFQRLQAAIGQLREWSELDRSDSATLAALASQVGVLTADIAGGILADLDRRLSDVEGTLAQWPSEEPKIVEAVTRLSWLLDGWDHILTTWDDSRNRPRHVQQQMVAEIARLLPVVPKDEIEKANQSLWEQLRQSMRKEVKPLESWMTGKLDLEMVLRVEKLKAGQS